MKMTFLFLMLVGLLAVNVHANEISQYSPIYDATSVDLNLEILNNDNGAVYDSYNLGIYSNLVARMWALPRNQSNYVDQAAMVADWILNLRAPPTGEVSAGWMHDSNYSDLEITNVGGIPDLDYDQWDATQQDASHDMMYLTLNIPLDQLDGDGDGWSAVDPEDWEIVKGDWAENVGVGHHGINSFVASGQVYSLMSLAPVSNSISGAVEVWYQTVSNQSYQAQYCTNMLTTNWVDMGEEIVGVGGETNFFDSTRKVEQRFYRVIKKP